MDKRALLRAVVAGLGNAAMFAAIPARAAGPLTKGTPVRFVVPFSPGGGADTIARLLAPILSDRLGVPVIVENRPGAGGTLGTTNVVQSPPDGHTVLFSITSLIQGPHLYSKLPYDPIKDLSPVALVGKLPSVFAVRADSPAKSIADFVRLAKADSKSYSLGNYGAGTLSNIQASAFMRAEQLDLVQASYAGAPPLLRAIVSGEVSGGFTDIYSATPLERSGRIRFLGITGTEPLSMLPDIPMLSRQGYKGLELYGWIGIFVSSKTPDAIVDNLSKDLRYALSMPEVRERLKSMAFVDDGGLERHAFAAMLKRDNVTWAKLIKDSNIRIDP